MTIQGKVVLLGIFLTLTSCTNTQNTQTPTPYPTVPMGATEIILLPSSGENFSAKGTEPFWNAEISASGVVFSRPTETGNTSVTYLTRQEERDNMIIIKDAKGEFFITLKKESCRDGMSGTEYAYKTTIALGSENLTGCANKK